MREFLSGSAIAVCGTVDDVVGTPRRLVGVVGNAQGVDVFSQECVSRERRDVARATLAFAGFAMLREKAESTAQYGQVGFIVPSNTAQQRFVAETGHQWVEGVGAWSVGDYYTAGNRLTPAAVKTGMFVVPAARATRALAGPALEAAALNAYLRLAPMSVATAEESAAIVFRESQLSIGAPAQLRGSGPVDGVVEVSSRVRSVANIQKYAPPNGLNAVEFIFDPKTRTMLVGVAPPNGSPHESLVRLIPNAGDKPVGGFFFRPGPDGVLYTNEFSGHYWQNWTPQSRAEFVRFLRSKGLKVVHHEGM